MSLFTAPARQTCYITRSQWACCIKVTIKRKSWTIKRNLVFNQSELSIWDLRLIYRDLRLIVTFMQRAHDHITLRFWASLDVSDSGFVFWDRNFIFFSLLINLFWTFFYFVFIMLGFPGITWNYFITWKLPGQDQNYPEITWFRVEWKHWPTYQ